MRINKLTPGFNLRWESSRMMLPEHRAQLVEERRKKEQFEPPILDEDELQQINRIINEAIKQNLAVTITYAEKDGPHECSGMIKKVNAVKGWLKVGNENESLILFFKKIIRVEIR